MVRTTDMATSIDNAFDILSRYAGEALVKSLGRKLGPAEIVASGAKLGWGRRLAHMKWFGVQ